MAFDPSMTDPYAGQSNPFHGSLNIALNSQCRSPVTEPERFVSADEAARFLAITRRHLLVLARNGIGGAYPAGTGSKRSHWVFRLSELAAAITDRRTA
ncbi:MAG TPA: hypothetical protein VMT20_07625 [Terriglobia bacterium]|nr:hypothetical protein [Terriglobia bacterium]